MKKLYFLFISILIINVSHAQWTQIGQDIDGEAAGDKSGYSVCLNIDGSILAIGAIENDGNGSNSGHVRVYENNAGTWTQIGQDIDGEAAGDNSGSSVSLNSDGTILAVGAIKNDGNGSDAGHVRVYENNAGTWIQIGNDIDGEAAQDYFGGSVSLSFDGTIVAVGAWGNDGNGTDAGHVRVFENQSNTWVQIGVDIDGEAAYDRSGMSISLSSDGSILAIGALYNNGNGSDAGHVRIYENQSGTWIQMGSDIDGEVAEDLSGAVSLSSDGSILAIGAVFNEGNGYKAGHVRVYENLFGTWTQIGNDIDGEAAEDHSGGNVKLSANGSILAINANRNDGNGFEAGHVRVYVNHSGNWTQIGNDIDGEGVEDHSGVISLNSEGSILAIGAPQNDGNGIDAGHVRIYGNPTINVIENKTNKVLSIYPNPTTGKITIEAEGVESVEVYNLQGQKISSKSEVGSPKQELDLSQQPKGIYIIKVTTSKGVAVEKVVLE